MSKANNLIIDGVDFIGTFYNEVKENQDKQMYIQYDDSYNNFTLDEWSEVVEFGYTRIAVADIGYFTGWIEYDKVKAVKIKVYRTEMDDYQEYIYK